MPWSTPRTWNPGETVTASLLNAHVRDNFNVVKTAVDDQGFLLTAVKTFAFSAGQGNAAGGADTQLTSYDVTIPMGFLKQPGDTLVLEGLWAAAANTNTKTAKMQVASGTLVTILSNAANVAGHVIPFQIRVIRRTQTIGAVTGILHVGAGAGGAPAQYLVNSGITSVNWDVSQTLKIFAASSAANDLRLTDYLVVSARTLLGATV